MDLSNFKKIETDDNLFFTGKVKYDIQLINSKSINEFSDISKSQEMTITSKLDKVESSFKVESSSGPNQNYRLDMYKNSKSGNGDYIIEERFSNGERVSVATTSLSIPVEDVSKSIISWNATPGWHNPPTNPPSNSYLIYNNASLSNIISGGSIALGIATGALVTIATLGLGAPIALGAGALSTLFVGLVTHLATAALPKNVSSKNVLFDFFYTVYPRPFYNASPAFGNADTIYPLYVELDWYLVDLPRP